MLPPSLPTQGNWSLESNSNNKLTPMQIITVQIFTVIMSSNPRDFTTYSHEIAMETALRLAKRVVSECAKVE